MIVAKQELSWGLCLLLLAYANRAAAFVAPPAKNSFSIISSMKMSSTPEPAPSLVVISPPGGVGEVTAVKAATMGSSVKWFVISPDEDKNVVVLSQDALAEVNEGGGKVELAGADVSSLLLPKEDPGSAISAVSMWTGKADNIVCTFDGITESAAAVLKEDNKGKNPVQLWKDAIKVAAKEASASITGTKLAILSTTEELYYEDDEGAKSGKGGGLEGMVGSFLGGAASAPVPSSILEALGGTSSKVTALRHGKLFGIPESSPDFSPLVGGPRRDPELCEEYTMRSVRIDPTISLSGNVMMGEASRSSRHSVGEAASLMVLGKIPRTLIEGIDVCLTSQLGTDAVPLELWEEEFQRSAKMLSSEEGSAPMLFSASFSSVPNVDRLTEWLATKWAPAVLRTYDIAAIRTGARPVYASRMNDGNKVEIVWQELVNFESINVGKVVLQISDNKLVATRMPGDAKKGYGTISRKPLQGEDVLVRRLAEAASQAIEKGLATRPLAPKKEKVKKPEPVAATVTSIQSSGTVEDASTRAGPRQTGARRSTERARGSRRRKSSTPPPPPAKE